VPSARITGAVPYRIPISRASPHGSNMPGTIRPAPARHDAGKMSQLRAMFQAVADERVPVPSRSKRVTPHVHTG
jgi:hypothetical protein